MRLANRERQIAHSHTGTRFAIHSGDSFGTRSHINQIVHVRMYMVGTPTVNNKSDVLALGLQAASMLITVTLRTGCVQGPGIRRNVQIYGRARFKIAQRSGRLIRIVRGLRNLGRILIHSGRSVRRLGLNRHECGFKVRTRRVNGFRIPRAEQGCFGTVRVIDARDVSSRHHKVANVN
eukprot:6207754-Pleurochrysis_carterae.AAC.1